MRYIAAYLLVALNGRHHDAKHVITAEDVKKVLTSVGVEVDAARLKKLIEDVGDKSIDEIIASGSSKLAQFGGAAAGAAASAGAAAGGDDGAAAAAAAAEAEKKKKEEEEEEADLGGGMDMFGGGSDY